MDSLRSTGIGQPPVPGMPVAARPANPAVPQQAPGDSVQISTGKSSLLDKAKNLGLGASIGLSATVLLDVAALAGAAAVVGTGSGLVALVATGMAAIHFGKKLLGKNQPPQQQQAPPPPPAAPPPPTQFGVQAPQQNGFIFSPGFPHPPKGNLP